MIGRLMMRPPILQITPQVLFLNKNDHAVVIFNILRDYLIDGEATPKDFLRAWDDVKILRLLILTD